MRRFAALYEALDRTTATSEKVEALRRYFEAVSPEDGAWALLVLTGGKLSRLVATAQLREWAREVAGVEPWLFEESYAIVGDFAETVALLVDASLTRDPESGESGLDVSLSEWIEARLLPLRGLEPAAQREHVLAWWSSLDRSGIFLLVKLLTGSLRVGVSKSLVVRAIALRAGLEPAVVAHRLMGSWSPTPSFFERLLAPGAEEIERSQPYPFFLASPVELATPVGPDETVAAWIERALGSADRWLAEWKWDGIRAQLIRRGGSVFLWSRGDENITETFPEIAHAAARLPDGTVLDGEVLAWRDNQPLPFGSLQRRLGRRTVGVKLLRDAPVVFIVYDALEHEGRDLREQPLEARRAALEQVIPPSSSTLLISPVIPFASWDELAERRAGSRERSVEGVMLKRRGSTYQVGRRRGDWWKWKIEALTIDAVLTYAQPGHGRRANLLTDYTFGVWSGAPGPDVSFANDDSRGMASAQVGTEEVRAPQRTLVTIAKAYSGLGDEEIARLDRWIRRHTVERFGPVRAVEPVLVFELAFDAAQRSTRHKSGVALRFPRIARWREDKRAEEADSIDDVRRLIREGR